MELSAGAGDAGRDARGRARVAVPEGVGEVSVVFHG